MQVNQKPTGRAMSVSGGLALGALWSTAVTVVLSAVLAKAVDLRWISMEKIGYGVMFLLAAAAYTGAMVSCGKIKHQMLVICFASGAIYWGILLSLTGIFFGGQYEAVAETGLMILCGCGLAVLTAGGIGGRGGASGKRKHRR